VYTGQLAGTHSLPSIGGLEVQWRGAYSTSHREDPDEKRVTYYRPLDDPTFPYEAAVNQRSWADLKERTLSGGVDFVLPVLTGKLKVGASADGRTSDYGIRYFNITPDFGAPSSLTRLPISEIYAVENYGPGKFLMTESSKPTDSYAGESHLIAGYVMADAPFQLFDQRFRISGGARLEHWDQTVTVPRTLEPNGPVDADRIDKTDILPSVNLTYVVSDNMNLRFAHYHSVNRPVFRERARTGYFDFVTYEVIAGNPALDRSYIHNYDVRFEVFPEVGELFAVSLFSKAISGAIEEQLGQSATRTRSWFNSPAGSNTGFELEARKSLGFLGEYWRSLMVTFNYARIYSTIEYTVTEGNSANTTFATATRPMQGQAPYIINVALLFTEPSLGTSLSVSYNRSGRRLQTVGFLSSDIYEEGRDLVDLGITQPVWGGLQVKFGIRNLLDRNRVQTRAGYRYDDSTIGRSYSLELGWSL
jgi:TonB-dependent receptor